MVKILPLIAAEFGLTNPNQSAVWTAG
jgi:hypothetical protein